MKEYRLNKNWDYYLIIPDNTKAINILNKGLPPDNKTIHILDKGLPPDNKTINILDKGLPPENKTIHILDKGLPNLKEQTEIHYYERTGKPITMTLRDGSIIYIKKRITKA